MSGMYREAGMGAQLIRVTRADCAPAEIKHQPWEAYDRSGGVGGNRLHRWCDGTM